MTYSVQKSVLECSNCNFRRLYDYFFGLVILFPVAGAGPAGQHPLPDLAGTQPHLHRAVPSKGYTFNITNSTSYDQYYVHGRTVFDVMVRITDDIFNTYIRKTGTVNPYYSEYCDGKSVTCPEFKAVGHCEAGQSGP